MSPRTPVTVRGRTRRRIHATLFAVVLLTMTVSGCITAFQEAAETLLGVEDWRPDDPTQEDYLIHVAEGLEAPHQFMVEGISEKLLLSRMPFEAEATDITVTRPHVDLLDMEAKVRGTALEEDGPGEDDHPLEFRLEAIDGTLTTVDGNEPVEDADLWVRAHRDEITLQGATRLSGDGGSVHLNNDQARVHTGGLRTDIAPPPTSGPSPVQGGWLGPLFNASTNGLVLTQVVVEFPDNRTKQGDLQIDPGAFRIGASSVRFHVDSFNTPGPDRSSTAAAGYRTEDPHGTISLLQHDGELRVHERSFDLGKRPVLHVQRLDRFDYDPKTSELSITGALIQIMEHRRPWIEARLDHSHPEQDEEGTIHIRAPPGETFRTLVAVKEVSNVGSAMDILPTRANTYGNLSVTFGDVWRDERVFRESAMESAMDAVSRIFVIPDGAVSTGPQTTAYLEVVLRLPQEAEEEGRTDFVLHARNAALHTVTIVMEPDAEAATTDVRTETPAGPVLVALTSLALILFGIRSRSWRKQ